MALIPDPAAIATLIGRVQRLNRAGPTGGLRGLWGGAGSSGSTWNDVSGVNPGSPAHLQLQGAAALAGDAVVLDGSAGAYLVTSSGGGGTPAFSPGIAGSPAVDAATWNRQGFTLGLVVAFDHTRAAALQANGAVLRQWHTGALQKIRFSIQPVTGYLDIWTASAVQGGVYQTAPPSDRRVVVAKNIWPYLLNEDDRAVALLISRGTWVPAPEHTNVLVDDASYENDGSGNGIGNHEDPATEYSIGYSQATPIIGDVQPANLEGTLHAAWEVSRYMTSSEMSGLIVGLVDAPGRSRNGIGLGISLGL